MSKTRGTSSSAFSPIMVISLILIGVFTFAAFISLSAFAPSLRDGNDGRAHALSKSAVGYAGLRTLLEETGRVPLILRRPPESFASGVWVLTPPSIWSLNEQIVTPETPDTVIILPKWQVVDDPEKKGWVRKSGVTTETSVPLGFVGLEGELEVNRLLGLTTPVLHSVGDQGRAVLSDRKLVNIGQVDHFQYLSNHDLIEPYVVAGENKSQVLIAKLVDQPVYIVSDPDIFNTHGLSDFDRTKIAFAVLDLARGDGPIMIDVTLHGIERTQNIIRLMLEPPLLGVTLSFLFALALLSIAAAIRFGPPVAAVRIHQMGKAGLADSSAALIKMAGREAAFGARYGEVVKRLIARAVGAKKPLTVENIDRLLRGAGKGEARDSFGAAMTQATQAQTPTELVDASKRLTEIKKEIARERI